MNYIIEKYNKFNKKEIQSGYRCKTFLLDNSKEKYIYQIYLGDTKCQARKKEYITTIIKNNIIIPEIPNIIEVGENDEFAYLVTEYKEGIEFNKIKQKEFNYHTFYKNLADILTQIHSIDIGNTFRMDWKRRITKKSFFL